MPRGFTLIEMLTVVAIIAVLAAVSIGAYRKFSDSSRTAEAMAMIGEFKTKEAAYFTEFNQYLPTGTADVEPSPSPTTNLYPVVGNGVCNEPCAKPITKPATWTTLGVAPTRNSLTCGYLVMAGKIGDGNAWNATTAAAKAALAPLTSATQPWFYVHAVCDNKAVDSRNTEYVAPYNQTSIVTYQDHDSASPPLP
jgi:prepilin-type N-terminal cleavage/methylation domain-containing protein